MPQGRFTSFWACVLKRLKAEWGEWAEGLKEDWAEEGGSSLQQPGAGRPLVTHELSPLRGLAKHVQVASQETARPAAALALTPLPVLYCITALPSHPVEQPTAHSPQQRQATQEKH